MGEHLGTIISVLIGGALTIIGTLLADILTSRRTREEAARERLVSNLYALTDHMNEMILGSASKEYQRFEAAKVQGIMQSVKIGDDPLFHTFARWVNVVIHQTYAESPEIAATLNDDQSDILAEVVARIYELLHVENDVKGFHKNVEKLFKEGEQVP